MLTDNEKQRIKTAQAIVRMARDLESMFRRKK